MADTRLYDRAHAILHAVGAAFTADGVPLPARQYVTTGEVAWDCEQLVVEVSRLGAGSSSFNDLLGPMKCGAILWMLATVHLVRCVPVPDNSGNAPNAAALDDAGNRALIDAWVLVHGLMAEMRDLIGPCDDWSVGPAVAVGPYGGYTGWKVDVRVSA